jgi:hypothetical protein
VKKGDRFPIQGRRLLPEGRGFTRERPLVIDPSRVDPGKHLAFAKLGNSWLLGSRNGSVEGKATIKAIKLDRDRLNEHRSSYIQRQLRPIVAAFRVAVGQAAQHRVKTLARQLCRPAAPYSLLARAYFRAEGVLP